MMPVIEYQKIELDFCPECHGVWFDRGELELFLASLSDKKGEIDKLVKPVKVSTGEKPRRCPVCRRKMQKTGIGIEPRVIVDSCDTYGHGFFFDGNEIAQIVKQLPHAGIPPKSSVTGFLGEVFKSIE